MQNVTKENSVSVDVMEKRNEMDQNFGESLCSFSNTVEEVP